MERSGCVTCWLGTAQSLIGMFVTLVAIREAVNTFRGTQNLINESEKYSESRLNHVAYLCSNLYEELENMTFFVHGLTLTTIKIVARFQENEPHQELKFDLVAQYDQDQGDEYRSKRVGNLNSKLPTREVETNTQGKLRGRTRRE